MRCDVERCGAPRWSFLAEGAAGAEVRQALNTYRSGLRSAVNATLTPAVPAQHKTHPRTALRVRGELRETSVLGSMACKQLAFRGFRLIPSQSLATSSRLGRV